jgi:hypothetical protein
LEQLIEFVFKHWYLAIIALTFFYQIRSKVRKANQGSPKRTGMPMFGETPGGAKRPIEAKKPVQKGNGPTLQSRGVQDDFGRSNADKPGSTMPKQKVSPFASPTQVSIDHSSVYADAISTPSPFPDELKQDQLLQGVVWAEILGPPRSKKPYRR